MEGARQQYLETIPLSADASCSAEQARGAAAKNAVPHRHDG